VTRAREHRHLPFDPLPEQPHRDAARGLLAGRELREDRHPEPGDDQRADGFQFAALAGDPRLKSGGATSRERGIAGTTLVEDEGFVREFRQADAPLLCDRVGFGHEKHKGLGEKQVLIEAAPRRGELDDAKLDASALDPLRDRFRSAFKEREFHPRVLLPKGGDHGREHTGTDRGDGPDAQASPTQTHEIPHRLPGDRSPLDEGFGVDPQSLAGRGEHGLAASAMEKRRAEFAFEIADLLAERGLREVQAGGGPGEVPLPGGFEEVFELVEFHRVFQRR